MIRIVILVLACLMYFNGEAYCNTIHVKPLKVKHINKSAIKVNISMYTISADETDSNPYETATGDEAIPGKTCAVSRDMRHLLGEHIYVSRLGKDLLVNDIMNKRFKKSIDVVVYTKKKAIKFGRQDGFIIVRKDKK